jgi:DNA topoisomerase-1
MALAEFAPFDSETAAKRNIRIAIESVASRLGNTTTICRKCYIHPEVLSCYLEGALVKTLSQKIPKEPRDDIADLKPEEVATLVLLQTRLAA